MDTGGNDIFVTAPQLLVCLRTQSLELVLIRDAGLASRSIVLVGDALPVPPLQAREDWNTPLPPRDAAVVTLAVHDLLEVTPDRGLGGARLVDVAVVVIVKRDPKADFVIEEIVRVDRELSEDIESYRLLAPIVCHFTNQAVC